jgi:beta-alanine degradation protein BauB
VLDTQAVARPWNFSSKSLQERDAADMLRPRGNVEQMNGVKAAVLVASLMIAPIHLQDAVTAPGYSVKVEFENEQIRVMRVHYAPHAKSPMHNHPGRLVVAVTDTHTRATTADGKSSDASRRAGDTYWSDSVTHQGENLLDTPIEVIEIELKHANSPGVPIATKPVNASKLKEPAPVEQEPHHHVVFQNQYVRVLDVFFPVGDPSLFHTHSNDNVSVALSGDLTKSQSMGGEWSKPSQVVQGQVAFHLANGQPYTHRVGSAGEKPFHVIDVEIFPAPPL